MAEIMAPLAFGDVSEVYIAIFARCPVLVVVRKSGTAVPLRENWLLLPNKAVLTAWLNFLFAFVANIAVTASSSVPAAIKILDLFIKNV